MINILLFLILSVIILFEYSLQIKDTFYQSTTKSKNLYTMEQLIKNDTESSTNNKCTSESPLTTKRSVNDYSNTSTFIRDIINIIKK